MASNTKPAIEKAVLVILDGVGDLQTPKTPLQMAKKPNLDALAKDGITGLMAPLGRGVVPGSDTSHLQYFGYDPERYYPGRGVLEALGAGIRLREGNIAFRANFATLNDTEIVDRRAGRIDSNSAKRLQDLLNITIDGVEIIFKSTVEHRGVVVLHGPGLSPAVSDTDPHTIGKLTHCEPLNASKESKKTADIINKFTNQARELLEKHQYNLKRKKKGLLIANGILLRGGGVYRKIDNIKTRFGISAACVAGGALYKGVARYIGMDVMEVHGATGTKDTNLAAKVQTVAACLKNYNLVFLHIKACDSFGHDGDCKGKTKMIERIDKEAIGPLRKALAKFNAAVVVTGDHSTPCSRKSHSGHEVPILVYGKNERKDEVKKFDEISCMKGGLGHITGRHLMPTLLNMIEKSKMYGS